MIMSVASNVHRALRSRPDSQRRIQRSLVDWTCGCVASAVTSALIYVPPLRREFKVLSGCSYRLAPLPSPFPLPRAPSESPLCFEGAIGLPLCYHRLAIGVERIVDDRLLLQHLMVVAQPEMAEPLGHGL